MSVLFEPSYGWQNIQDGTVLPPGLQVELDVTTGHKRARMPLHPALAKLANLKQWCAWEAGTKRPLNPRSRRGFKELNRSILVTIEEVKGSLVGFYAFADDEWILLDLDKVRDPGTGKVVDWAEALVRLLDSYTEVSPSGTGLHIIIRCRDKPREGYVVQKYGGAKIEVRVNAQYITITGDAIHGNRIKEHPREILDHPLFRAANGDAAEAPKHRTGGRAEAKLGIIVAADRVISSLDLMLLQENHPDLWQVWNKKATPARDATHSGYMASLARRFARMGKEDQWIAEALVAFCHRHKRLDCIDQRQIERCIILARSDPTQTDERPEALQAAVDAMAEDDALEGVDDKRGEALRILGSYFRMPISDIRRFGKTPGRVQLLNCEEWLDIGTPAQVLDQRQVLATVYHVKGIVILRAKPERWARIATLIAQNWRIEDPGDEEVTVALEEMIDALINRMGGDGHPATTESMMNLRACRSSHDWQGKRYVFASKLKMDAKMNGLLHLHQALRSLGYQPETVAAAGKTSRSAWVKEVL